MQRICCQLFEQYLLPNDMSVKKLDSIARCNIVKHLDGWFGPHFFLETKQIVFKCCNIVFRKTEIKPTLGLGLTKFNA